MSKRLILVLALVFVAAFAVGAYAEVQNVKVSGDITVTAVDRHNFDLSRGPKGDRDDDQLSTFLTQTRVRIDADLTDNVMTTVRLINERNWNVEDANTTDINIDLAYVTLKEFLYSPLSLTIGRQELHYGNDLIIGDVDTNRTAVNISNGMPGDLSLRKAFDAIKATLNYDPLSVDLVYAKINENSTGTSSGSLNDRNDDTDLYGINATWAINAKNTLQGYIWSQYTHPSGSTAPLDQANKTHTLGALLTSEPIDNLKTSVEAAMQFGNDSNSRKRRAYALQAMADYGLPGEKLKKYSPMIGAGWTYLSGDNRPGDSRNSAWNPMYENQNLNDIPNGLFTSSNLNVFTGKASVKPAEDIKLSAIYGAYYLAKRLEGGFMNTTTNPASTNTYVLKTDETFLGHAFDLVATYDYTEDVQLGLRLAWFQPGAAFSEANRRAASEALASMKVTF